MLINKINAEERAKKQLRAGMYMSSGVPAWDVILRLPVVSHRFIKLSKFKRRLGGSPSHVAL